MIDRLQNDEDSRAISLKDSWNPYVYLYADGSVGKEIIGRRLWWAAAFFYLHIFRNR